MDRLLRRYPGELMVLAFVLMGLAFVVVVAAGEKPWGPAGVGYPGLIDGADWQATEFPAERAEGE